MIIGIDGNEANIEKRVGVNTYAFELLHALHKTQSEWSDQHHLIVYLKNKPCNDMPKETATFKYKIIPGGGLWILTKLMPDLFWGSPRPDVFFSPSHYAPLFSPMPKVVSIMDLGYLEFSEQFAKKDFWQLKLWTASSILVSKAIIAISNSTKQEIVRHYPLSKDKIQVTHLAYDKEKFNMNISQSAVERVKNKYAIVGDYILYLSTLKPSKNVEGLIEAFAKIQNLDSKFQLVIAGKKGWLFDSIYKKVTDLGLKDKIIFTDYISEEDKPALIKGSKVFVLPSFWEGFGLDVLNAMACGVPVVVSKVGSLPEVVGDAGVLVDPYNINSIAEGIKTVLFADSKKYNSIVKKGLGQVKKFSWEKAARETLEILTHV
ncbi:MAG TPA: glycosyltransferase family 1 protein [Alphaproteobacteria bacterium]|jgi:glycosyltransferase involved in cell wall biosynthesis|nr:glycosyltransferase family 1 protein [Alphaproteobacteria bacterium]